MKVLMNFTTYPDDLQRYESYEDLRNFYRQYGCDSLELMPMGDDPDCLAASDMVIGMHARYISDWMGIIFGKGAVHSER